MNFYRQFIYKLLQHACSNWFCTHATSYLPTTWPADVVISKQLRGTARSNIQTTLSYIVTDVTQSHTLSQSVGLSVRLLVSLLYTIIFSW